MAIRLNVYTALGRAAVKTLLDAVKMRRCALVDRALPRRGSQSVDVLSLRVLRPCTVSVSSIRSARVTITTLHSCLLPPAYTPSGSCAVTRLLRRTTFVSRVSPLGRPFWRLLDLLCHLSTLHLPLACTSHLTALCPQQAA